MADLSHMPVSGLISGSARAGWSWAVLSRMAVLCLDRQAWAWCYWNVCILIGGKTLRTWIRIGTEYYIAFQLVLASAKVSSDSEGETSWAPSKERIIK